MKKIVLGLLATLVVTATVIGAKYATSCNDCCTKQEKCCKTQEACCKK
jgi:hypothetical protein